MSKKIFLGLFLVLGFLFLTNFSQTNASPAPSVYENNNQEDYECGTTDANLLDQNFKPEENDVLVCLGKALFNNCSRTKALIGGDLFEIKGDSMNECLVGNAEVSSTENINNYIKEMEADPKFYPPESYPGTLAATVIFTTAFKNINPDDSWKTLPPDNRPTYDDIFSQAFINEIIENLGVDNVEKSNDCKIDYYAISDGCRYDFNKNSNHWFNLKLERADHEILSYQDNSSGNSVSFQGTLDCPSKAHFDIEKAKAQAKSDYGNLVKINENVKKIEKSNSLKLNNWDSNAYFSISPLNKLIALKGSWVLEFDFPNKNEINDEEFNNLVSIIDEIGKKTENAPVDLESVQIKNTELGDRLKGKIILQVEQNGEAYYINPTTEYSHYLGRPTDAFSVMRNQGVGIKNVDISNIPVALSNLTGADADGDGLPDKFEDAVGTNMNNSDTDGDGYSDKQELESNYDPRKGGGVKLNINNDFAEKQKGKILLQVEQNGEAWYINPEDGKRYFLGRPADAFQVMRNLGLGISNEDFGKL